MSRGLKLVAGVLALVIAGVVLLMPDGKEDVRQIIGAVFGIPGLLLLILGLRAALPVEQRAHVRMIFLPGRMAAGLLLSAVSVAVLYVFFNVLHVMPQIVMIGALLGVPAGLLIAGLSWDEACRGCAKPFNTLNNRYTISSIQRISPLPALQARANTGVDAPLSMKYCATCRQLAIVKGAGIPPQMLVGKAAQVLVDDALSASAASKR
ncbi:MAG: hypothetical protein ABI411_19375 [Tahibacter sp.]